jgi:hypothetical protein
VKGVADGQQGERIRERSAIVEGDQAFPVAVVLGRVAKFGLIVVAPGLLMAEPKVEWFGSWMPSRGCHRHTIGR